MLTSNNGEFIAGNATVDISQSGIPEIAEIESKIQNVTLYCGSGVSLDPKTPESFIFALPPVTFSNEFTLNIYDDSGNCTSICSNAANEVSRSAILVMPSIEYKAAAAPQVDLIDIEFLAGGTSLMIQRNNRDGQEHAGEIAFLINVSPSSSSKWVYAYSGIIPEVVKYYHVVGVWNKNLGKSYVYVDGQLAGETAAEGNFIFPSNGSLWFGIGGDSSTSYAQAAFNGDIVIARAYDASLTEEQIKLLNDRDGKMN